jgi:hypothetical protein
LVCCFRLYIYHGKAIKKVYNKCKPNAQTI